MIQNEAGDTLRVQGELIVVNGNNWKKWRNNNTGAMAMIESDWNGETFSVELSKDKFIRRYHSLSKMIANVVAVKWATGEITRANLRGMLFKLTGNGREYNP